MKVEIRPLQESDLPEADRVFRLAFGTFLGLPEPESFVAGADLIATRWRAGACNAAFGAFDGASLIGSNFAANWGSFGFFGPLTVRPDYWDKGVAQLLLEPAMDTFARWGVRAAGLFTFPQSPKHLGLYQKHDFWPQHLTAVMAKPVDP
jgi:GNAT superfamily N-acetyltransferase